ncbi:MAG: LysM peptidoglycan-binding domain-containing protein [Anaerolineales bacterium]|nr:LysM peptidoglycan-binding domain-containing protein [Anaerolineales bacterium]
MMKRFEFWMFIPLLVLISGLTMSERVSAQPGYFSPAPSSLEIVDEVNKLRNSSGLPEYQVNPVLTEIAQSHAEYLARINVETHFSENGNRPYQRALAAGYSVAGDLDVGGFFAEAIHSGANLSAPGVVTFWQGDTANSNAMLSSIYEDVGVGMASSKGITYIVLNAGKESDVAIPTLTPTVSSSEFVVATAGGFGTPAIIVSLSTPLANGEIFHIVKKNEGLWSIALAYGTSVEQLKSLNGLATDAIFEGQSLLVFRPVPNTATPSPVVTATLGIPTSTATILVTPTLASTATPLPVAPTSRQRGEVAVGIIVLVALLAAGIGAWLGRK